MKNKIYRDLSILIVVVGILFAFIYYIPWIQKEKRILTIEKEQELGEKLFDNILDVDNSIILFENNYIDSIIDIFSSNILKSNPDFEYKYRIEIIDDEIINAFTLPGGIILVNTGMLQFVDSPEELIAVLLHEMGHVENRDIISRLIKELGLNLLFSQDAYVLGEITHNITSLKYDRKQEERADLFAQKSLEKMNIEPRILGKFFRRLKEKDGDIPEYLTVISTHPNLTNRIKKCLEYKVSSQFQEKPLNIDWEEFQSFFETKIIDRRDSY